MREKHIHQFDQCSTCGALHEHCQPVAPPTAPPADLLAALTAARDLLVGCQKHAGYLPEQRGYSTMLTAHEMSLARGIESLDAIIATATAPPALTRVEARQHVLRVTEEQRARQAAYLAREAAESAIEPAVGALQVLVARLEHGAALIEALGQRSPVEFSQAEFRFMRDHPALAECATIMRQAADALLRSGGATTPTTETAGKKEL